MRNRPIITELALRLVATVSLLLTPCIAAASTYYVATSGSDSGAGTIGAPWLTLRFAVSQLQAGDTLYIRGGTYTGGANIIDSSNTVRGGTSWSTPITIAGYPDETVVLQPSGGTGGIRLNTTAQKYIIFQDFAIDGVNQPNAHGQLVYQSGGANHIRYLRLDVRNGYDIAFHISDNNGDSPYNEFLQCSIHGMRNPAGAHGGDAMYLFTNNNLIEGNDIYNNEGYGIHMYADGSNGVGVNANNNVVRNNKIHHNGSLSSNNGFDYGILVRGGNNNRIYNNILYENRGAIEIYTSSTNTHIYNNTIYNNRPNEGILTQYTDGPTFIMNNIIYNNATAVKDMGAGTLLSNNLTVNPSFVNVGANDFSLLESSAAIDSGTAVSGVSNDIAGTARPQGRAFDIGAYERGDDANKLPPPTGLRISLP